jgi:RND family efflux transporter MFP subunit
MKKTIIGILIVAVIALGIFLLRGDTEPKFDTAEAQLGNIIQEVSVTGKVRAANNIDLAFEGGGRVDNVYVRVNDRVFQGQKLVELESTDLRADLAKTEADQTKQIAQLVKDQITLDNYYDDVLPILRDAYSKSSDAVRKQLDELFINDDKENVSITFLTSNSQFELDAESRRRDLSGRLVRWKAELDKLSLSADNSDLEMAIKNSREHLDNVSAFLDSSLNTVLESVTLVQATVTAYKDNIYTAQNNVNSVRTIVRDIDQSIVSQKAGLAVQEAAIKSSEASMKTAEAKLEKTVLRAPFGGTVVKQEADIGEIVASSEVIVSLISDGIFEVEAFVPEVDIANIRIGHPAIITLDAYGNDVVFEAGVVSVDPSETVIEGVSTYKTVLKFKAVDSRIRPGMTANIDIQTASKEGVLIIPQRAVVGSGDKTIVRATAFDGTIQEIPVVTGLRGSDGNIEIVEGLSAGQKVITFLPED